MRLGPSQSRARHVRMTAAPTVEEFDRRSNGVPPSAMGLTDLPERGVRRFDDFQQERRWLALPIGTIRKYADDRGSAFAGLVTFQVFLGMLPLLVVALTVLGELLETDADLEQAVLDSAIAQFPIIGTRLEEDVSTIAVSGWWIYISIAGLLWTSAGIYHSLQLALNQVWNVGGVHRQGFVSRHLRALLLFVLVISVAIATYYLRNAEFMDWAPPIVDMVGAAIVGAALSAVMLLLVFRIVTAPVVATRLLVPAAIVGGVFWEVLQSLGAWIVGDRLSQAEDLYGAIGFVVVALFWINLLARSAILANEFAVVVERRLWPRRIAQPPLTEADRRVLEGLLNNERRRPEEHVTVSFDPDADAEPDGGSDRDGDDHVTDDALTRDGEVRPARSSASGSASGSD
jgi:YihY family inner membrane protein